MAGVSAFLIVSGLRSRGSSLLGGALWDLQNSAHLKAAVVGIGVSALLGFLAYVAVGFLAVVATPFLRAKMRLANRPIVFALMVCALLSSIVSVAATGPGWQWPSVVDMILPLAGGTLGSWIGIARTSNQSKALGIKLAIVVGLGMLAFIVMVPLVFASTPLSFQTTDLTSVDRVRLVNLIKSKSPAAVLPGKTSTLTLTERDVNLLLAWGLSLGSPDRKAKVALGENQASLLLSARLPFGRQSLQYLNVVATGHAGVHEGELDLRIDALRVGRLKMPRPLLWLLGAKIARTVRSEPLAIPVLAEIRQTRIGIDEVSASYRRIDMPDGFRKNVFGALGSDTQVQEALAAQLDLIVTLSQQPDPLEDQFSAFVQTAFQLAQRRSQTRDPVVENRAAIIALGIAFGHSYVGKLIGPFPHQKLSLIPKSTINQLKLRGRSDWSRHFLVSAALEVISAESLSYDAGLLKEELDAGSPGGSGFSFADLAADRAGVMLGKVATEDEDSAQALQANFLWSFDVNSILPPVDDLPENISQQTLDTDYDGVDGQRYKSLLAEIDRRIAACRAYQHLF